MSYGRNGANDGCDFLGRELKVGQQVVKAHVFGRSPGHELKTVSKVEGGQVYLNGWHSPVQYSGRLCIVFDDTPRYTVTDAGRAALRGEE